MKRRRHKLLTALAFLLYIILLSACKQEKKERVCVYIITTTGREYVTGFMLPVNGRQLEVNSYQGVSCLQYKDCRWWHGKWITLKEGVENFYLTECKY